jgi:hypothetical protein
MNYKKLEGKWKGSYEYGDVYPKDFIGKIEPFELDILFDGPNFKGTCTDRFTETLFQAPASIEGTFDPNLISFIKKYPGYLSEDDSYNPVIIPEKEPVPIHYTGFYYKGWFSRKIRFEGEWVLPGYYLDEKGKEVPFIFSGTWKMVKIL